MEQKKVNNENKYEDLFDFVKSVKISYDIYTIGNVYRDSDAYKSLEYIETEHSVIITSLSY